jgi:hypothetical protein
MKHLLFLISLLICFFSKSQFTSIVQPTINSFKFVEINESAGVSLAGGVKLIKSLDNGYTWQEVSLGIYAMPNTNFEFNGALILSSVEYYLIGLDVPNSRSCVLKTTNGGISWQLVLMTAVGSQQVFNDFEYGDGSIVVGGKGQVYVSDDFGANWTIHTVGSSAVKAKNMNFNPLSNAWLSTFSNSTHNISYNKWLNYSTTAIPFGNSTVEKVNCSNNKFVASMLIGSTSKIYEFDQNAIVLDTISILNSLTYDLNILEADYLPNGNIIARTEGHFLFIDTATEFHYFFNHLLQGTDGNPAETRDFDLGQTFGLAVGMNGSISRIDFSSLNDLYLPGFFTSSSNSGCLNSPISATPMFDYADSYAWYMNGVLISTDYNLNTTAPSIPGTHELKLTVTYDGNQDSSSWFFTLNPLIPIPSYTFNVNLTPCFNQTSSVQLIYQGGNTAATSLTASFSGQNFYGPVSLSTSNLHFQTPIIDQTDTLEIVIQKIQSCATTYDTLEFILVEGDDLSDNFELLTNSDFVCSGLSAEFELTGLSPGNIYTISNSINSSTTVVSFSGNTTDTVIINGPLSAVSVEADIERFFTINISNGQGCSYQTLLDSVLYTNPIALFETSSDAYLLNDTVFVLNQRPHNSMEWSVLPNDLLISNLNDTVPELVGSSYGFHKIMLKNEPFIGCSDSSFVHVFIGDSLPLMQHDQQWAYASLDLNTVQDVHIDQFGNIYELAVRKAVETFAPDYWLANELVLIKRDPNGAIIWIEDINLTSSYEDMGAVIESIEIDENGNVYAAFWIESNNTFNYGLINYSQFSIINQNKTYIVKYDGNSGQMLWYKDLTSFPVGYIDGLFNQRIRVSDLVLTEDLIYFSIVNQWGASIGCMDYNGNYVSHQSLGLNLPNYFYQQSGALSSEFETIKSLKLEKLSTNEILICTYYSGGVILENVAIPELYTNPTRMSILLAKYSLSDGIHELKKVTTSIIPVNYNNLDFMDQPNFQIDSEDNITIAFKWDTPSIEINGDTIFTERGGVVIQYDKYYNFRWMNRLTRFEPIDLKVASGTNDIYLLGLAPYNYGIGNESQHYYSGINPNPEFIDSLISTDYFYLSNLLFRKDIFITRMDQNGQILDGKSFIHSNPIEPIGNVDNIKSRMDVTPCGDIVLSILNVNHDNFPIELTTGNSSFTVDSSYLLKFSMSPDPLSCSFFPTSNDTLYYCQNQDSITIHFEDYYNVDSISYHLIIDNVVSTEYEILNLGQINVALNNEENIQLLIISPIVDTIFLIRELFDYAVDFDSISCLNQQIQFTANSSQTEYLWDEQFVGQTYQPNMSIFSEGLNSIQLDFLSPLGCSIRDTIFFQILQAQEPVLNGFEDSICYGETLSIYSSLVNTVFTMSTGSQFIDSVEFGTNEYQLGANFFSYSYTDSIGCIFSATENYFIITPENPLISSPDYEICNEEETMIIASPSYFNITWDINGETNDTLVVNSSMYNIGTNYFNFVSIDMLGCVSGGTMDIIVHDIPQPTFSEFYQVECDEFITITFNDQDYSVIQWYINGNSQANYFSNVNLVNGLNDLEIHLETINGCSIDTTIVIDYCYDLGVDSINPNDVLVYPNPSNGIVYLDFALQNDGTHLFVFDQSWREIDNFFLLDQYNRIDLSHLSQGFYFLKVKNHLFHVIIN